ncbi:DUF1415 domain-containing protein [Simiduia sp. 21SJ11W-1]|uniref:DUF1415 domain-containing protein n=1 Tax=Simiduia sp. 21SJ11W-1 TaxID=2909669 RepID=UPI00209FACD9|nr:DUF1415 domain-containing protein [Simiduia sp. 21SJ11W-1]UTA47848.1 DUF1415 domain-containing protein [Simiduia sp. 21SJ11W-1]
MAGSESAASAIISATEQWLHDVVIGLNLCPFARKPARKGAIRYAVASATDDETLMAELLHECQLLDEQPADALETTLLIVPGHLQSFEDFNHFLNLADWLIERHEYEGVYQLATFHPHYQFAGTAPDDAENLTNRAPYPILHLLREASLTQVLESYPNPEAIPEHNIARVRGLTQAECKKLFPYLFR